MDGMGILDNFENAWDDNFEFESKPMTDKDAMGREKFWEDLGRPESELDRVEREKYLDNLGIYSIEGLALQEEPNLAVKLFSETCCSDCTCGNDK
jgi:hypothetical protein